MVDCRSTPDHQEGVRQNDKDMNDVGDVGNTPKFGAELGAGAPVGPQTIRPCKRQ